MQFKRFLALQELLGTPNGNQVKLMMGDSLNGLTTLQKLPVLVREPVSRLLEHQKASLQMSNDGRIVIVKLSATYPYLGPISGMKTLS